MCWFFFFKQKTAYEMSISDWSSDVCSSDLAADERHHRTELHAAGAFALAGAFSRRTAEGGEKAAGQVNARIGQFGRAGARLGAGQFRQRTRSEERRVGKECVSTVRSGWLAHH